MNTLVRKFNRAKRRVLHFLTLERNRLRFTVHIDKQKKKLVIDEKYEKFVKNLSRITALLGFVLIFITLPFPISILVGLSIFVLEQILERTIFSFKTLYLVPFPSFETWRKANFLASYFGISDRPGILALVGMVFENKDAAAEVFGFVSDWNYGKSDDPKNNVCISIVIDEAKDKYAMFVYPSLEREDIKSFQKKNKKPGKEAMHGVGLMILCKTFPYKKSGLARIFLPMYKGGDFYFRAYTLNADGIPEPITNSPTLLKHHIKIKRRKELTKKDVEKHMSDFNIDWDDDSPVQPGRIYKVEPK